MTRRLRLPLLLCIAALASCDDKTKSASEPGDDDPKASASKPDVDQLPKLDTDAAARAVDAIESASEDMKGKLAAAALAELEVQRLGPSFVAGLDALTQAAPDKRAASVAKSIEQNVGMLDDACEADGRKTMGSLATLDASERQVALWKACKFEKLGLVSKDVGMKADGTATILAHMAFAKLKKHGESDPNERKLLELLAATSEEKPPTPPSGDGQ